MVLNTNGVVNVFELTDWDGPPKDRADAAARIAVIESEIGFIRLQLADDERRARHTEDEYRDWRRRAVYAERCKLNELAETRAWLVAEKQRDAARKAADREAMAARAATRREEKRRRWEEIGGDERMRSIAKVIVKELFRLRDDDPEGWADFASPQLDEQLDIYDAEVQRFKEGMP